MTGYIKSTDANIEAFDEDQSRFHVTLIAEVGMRVVVALVLLGFGACGDDDAPVDAGSDTNDSSIDVPGLDAPVDAPVDAPLDSPVLNDGGTDAGSTEVCSDTAEIEALRESFDEETAIEMLRRRYGSEEIAPMMHADYAAMLPGVGDWFTEPAFGYRIRVASNNVEGINSERRHWNADATLAFFLTGNARLSLFDAHGEFVRELRFESDDGMDAVRWHPTDPTLLVYPREDELRMRDINTNEESVLRRFNVGTLGTGNRRIAGGDGNDFEAGRILLSAGGKNTNCFVYELATDSVVRTNEDGTETLVPVEDGVEEPSFDLPDIDYALLSPSGTTILVLDEDNGGTDLYDLSGRRLGQIYERTPHLDTSWFTRADGTVVEGLLVKQIGAIAPTYDRRPGDMDIITWTYDFTASSLQRDVFLQLDWLRQPGEAGGGQLSAVADNRVTALLSIGSTLDGFADGGVYFDEIVELSLLEDDLAPRRIAHHMVTRGSPVELQPESWTSPDGRSVYFQSHVGDELDGDEYLFFVDLPPRTCPAARAALLD